MTALLQQTTTREQWLTAAASALGAHFFPVVVPGKKIKGEPAVVGEHDIPKKIACSCGFAWRSQKAIGQCFSPTLSADGTTHMFICPTQEDPVRVLDILLHELGHAALGVEAKHGPLFKKFCQAVGLSGKATATIAEPGSELYGRLEKIARDLGPYPHRALSKSSGKSKEKSGKKGWVRMQSMTEPEYKVVISPAQLEEHGAPLDPWGEPMVEVEK